MFLDHNGLPTSLIHPVTGWEGSEECRLPSQQLPLAGKYPVIVYCQQTGKLLIHYQEGEGESQKA